MLRTLWCGFSLGVAILTIVLVTLFVPILPKLVTWHDPKGFLALFIVGSFVIGLIALPVFSFAAYVRSVKSITSPYYWLGVGGVVAFIANLLLAAIFIPYTQFIILNSSMIGGVVGGFVYSLFHSKETLPMMVRDLKIVLARINFKHITYFSKPSLVLVTS